MKKHILGLAIFGFILSLFAVAFAFFYVPPIPQITEVNDRTNAKQPIINYEKTSCFRKKENDITYEINNIQFDVKSEIITSSFKLKWNGLGEPPKQVSMNVHHFTLENDEEGLFDEIKIIPDPFKGKNEVTVTIQYKLRYDLGIDPKKNLYALVEFNQNEKFMEYVAGKEDMTKAKQVLFVHDNVSEIKK